VNPYQFTRRNTHSVLNIGGENVPRVINDLNFINEVNTHTLAELGYTYFQTEDKWGISDLACDYIDIGKKEIDFEIPGTLGIMQAHSVWVNSKKDKHYPCLDVEQFLSNADKHPQLNFLYLRLSHLTDDLINAIKMDETVVLLLDTFNQHGMAEQRELCMRLIDNNCTAPIIIGRAYENLPPESLQLYTATDMGALLVDGLGDGVYIAAENCGKLSIINNTAFGILQASRMRITKTEYISCPSCGRTLFDLQETTARIRSRTEHLKGVKIGIMGCIVNGPGEMADADYGYVGTGVGKITLYKGQEVVSKNLDTTVADEALIQLIKDHGDWVEPV
jgi:(E)-4-hydroxy-3-methylbut-2-enyl-diphosphate synthase